MDTDVTQVACPHCLAINRVPDARLEEGPNCGRCHQSLFTGRPLVLDEAGFDAHAGRSDLPLLVDFWAPWCGPCRMMAPHFESVAAKVEPKLRLAKVDTDQVPALGARFAIRSIPTLIIFRDGHELARHSGAMGANEIIRFAYETLTA